MSKFIGISASFLIETEGMTKGYKLSCVGFDFTNALISIGAIPLILPIHTNKDVIKAQLNKLDALILSGGHDLNPLLYGQEPHKLLQETSDERDKFDFLLLEEATKLNLPLLGICRGMQILNVFNGGTLYQDNSLAENSFIKHVQGHSPTYRSHTVNFAKNSKLKEIFGEKTLVNSFHHMSLDKVAPNFKITAKSNDGIIEAIEKKEGSLAIGVQWHPEMLYKDEKMLDIFRLLLD